MISRALVRTLFAVAMATALLVSCGDDDDDLPLDATTDAGADAGADVPDATTDATTDAGADAADAAADTADAGADAGDAGADVADAGADIGDAADAGADTADVEDADAGGDTADTEDAGIDADTGPASFTLRIENTSGVTALPTPFAPGVWAVHTDAVELFTPGAPEAGLGLEALAEDGAPADLAASIAGLAGVDASGVFERPVGAATPAPILPGEAYEITFEAEPGTTLSFATMLGQSNDLFMAPPPEGLALFGLGGDPLPARDATGEVLLWDTGTEENEAPLLGPWQAPRQPGPDMGPAEGVIRAFGHTTRAVPAPASLADIEVTAEGLDTATPTYALTITNASMERGALVSPLSPMFWAVHDDSFQLFEEGELASEALESLAEDGSPAALVAAHTGAANVGSVGAAVEPVETPGAGAAPIMPGQSYELEVSPTADFPLLTIASMVGQTNDAFMAPPPAGIRLFDEEGTPRPAEAVQADLERMLATWDAGTEGNEVPGVGPHQAPRQIEADSGPDDPTPGVRRYDDSTNDLAPETLGQLVSLSVVNGTVAGDFDVTLGSVGAGTAFPAMLSPLLWVLHDDSVALFEADTPAPAELEALAEDGDPAPWLGALMTAGLEAGVLDTPVGAVDPGPLSPGDLYQGTVTPTAASPMLSIATMVVPSNDTFLALGEGGIRLLDELGAPRSDADIAADVAALLAAFDAGTEANQGGALGRDMAPHQEAPNTGAPEGDGTVRQVNDPVWSWPPPTDMLRITIGPVQ